MGVYTGPPLKNTILGRYQPLRSCSRRIPEKSTVPPPADGPAGGGEFPHFFSDFGDNRVWLAGTLLKNWSKQGVPLFERFLAILGQSGPNRCIHGAPLECKVLNKRITCPWGGVSPEATRRVYFVRTVPLVPKYTLQIGRASCRERVFVCV